MMTIGPYYAQDSMYYKTASQMVSDFEDFMNDEIYEEMPEEERGPRFRLPTEKEVCPQCQGKGRHVNRSIDGNGLSQEMMDDYDFMDDYMAGHYDVTCTECHGENVIDVVNEDALSPEIRKQWQEWQRDCYDSVAENLAELRMGA